MTRRIISAVTFCILFSKTPMPAWAEAPTRSTTAPATQPATNPAAQKIKLSEFAAMRTEKDALVIDVRTPKEYAAGHVPGAVNIDWHRRDFNEQILKLDKSKKLLVHCMAGRRSAAASQRMGELGFTKVFDYSGGWSEYSKSSQPVEK